MSHDERLDPGAIAGLTKEIAEHGLRRDQEVLFANIDRSVEDLESAVDRFSVVADLASSTPLLKMSAAERKQVAATTSDLADIVTAQPSPQTLFDSGDVAALSSDLEELSTSLERRTANAWTEFTEQLPSPSVGDAADLFRQLGIESRGALVLQNRISKAKRLAKKRIPSADDFHTYGASVEEANELISEAGLDSDLPESVLRFLTAAATGNGVSLDQVEDEAWVWLSDTGHSKHFRIVATDL